MIIRYLYECITNDQESFETLNGSDQLET